MDILTAAEILLEGAGIPSLRVDEGTGLVAFRSGITLYFAFPEADTRTRAKLKRHVAVLDVRDLKQIPPAIQDADEIGARIVHLADERPRWRDN